MKKYITLCVDFPKELPEDDIKEYIINSVEGYYIETGYLARVFTKEGN